MKVAINLFGLIPLVGIVLIAVNILWLSTLELHGYPLWMLLPPFSALTIGTVAINSILMMFVREYPCKRLLCATAIILCSWVLFEFVTAYGLYQAMMLFIVGMVLSMVGMALCMLFDQFEISVGCDE